jgi:hypothetical protein
MTARDGYGMATPPHTIDAKKMAAISPLPPPEEVFIDWLMSVPPDDCLEAAARCQIEIIDRSAVFLHPDVRHLRTLLVAVAGDADWPRPISSL